MTVWCGVIARIDLYLQYMNIKASVLYKTAKNAFGKCLYTIWVHPFSVTYYEHCCESTSVLWTIIEIVLYSIT